MPVRTHHTASAVAPQPPDPRTEAWTTDVGERLPADLDTQAHTLKAFRRPRGIRCPADLLRGLLAYVLETNSFRLLGIWAVLQGIADISDTAWRTHLRNANPWLLWLLGELLAAEVACAPDLALRQRRICLVDATRLCQIGGSGDDWRAHLCFDLLAGRMGQVIVTDRHTAERMQHFAIQEGDIYVGDGGYGYRNNLVYVRAKHADGVLRIHPTTFPLEDAAGRAFDALAWLLRQHATLAEWHGFCRYKGQRIAVRLVASKIPPDKLAKAQARKKRKAKKRGRKLTAKTLILAGWWLLITTLSAHDWPATEVVRLYQARWQIELVFKRIKQLLRVASLRGKRPETVEPTIRALLVAWAMEEQLAAEVRALLPTGARSPTSPASSWLLAGLSVQTVRQQVRGTWTIERIRACLPRLVRFLVSSPRKRRQQEAELRQWLEERLRRTQPLRAAA
jgi:Transposase DDE domain